MAIKGLSPWAFRRELKPDTCLVTPAPVYRGSHPSSNLKSRGLHVAIRPASSMWSIQYSPITVGGEPRRPLASNGKGGRSPKSFG